MDDENNDLLDATSYALWSGSVHRAGAELTVESIREHYHNLIRLYQREINEAANRVMQDGMLYGTGMTRMSWDPGEQDRHGVQFSVVNDPSSIPEGPPETATGTRALYRNHIQEMVDRHIDSGLSGLRQEENMADTTSPSTWAYSTLNEGQQRPRWDNPQYIGEIHEFRDPDGPGVFTLRYEDFMELMSKIRRLKQIWQRAGHSGDPSLWFGPRNYMIFDKGLDIWNNETSSGIGVTDWRLVQNEGVGIMWEHSDAWALYSKSQGVQHASSQPVQGIPF